MEGPSGGSRVRRVDGRAPLLRDSSRSRHHRHRLIGWPQAGLTAEGLPFTISEMAARTRRVYQAQSTGRP
eukprot:7142118-Prymnesium_polylepis.2